MQTSYNKAQKLVVYSFDGNISCFGLTPEKAFEICPELDSQAEGVYPLNYLELSDDVFSELRSAHTEQLFKNVSGYQVSKCAKVAHVKLLAKASKLSLPVMVEYEAGYEMFNEGGFVSDNGLVHTCWIGKSTGVQKTLLHLDTPHSSGGAAFSFHGLKSVTLIETKLH
jgi:hypothetical protein